MKGVKQPETESAPVLHTVWLINALTRVYKDRIPQRSAQKADFIPV